MNTKKGPFPCGKFYGEFLRVERKPYPPSAKRLPRPCREESGQRAHDF
jgi:hypothetical protein